MFHDTTVFIRGKDVTCEGRFSSDCGPVIRFLVKVGYYEDTKILLFLENETCATVLEALESITEKMRLYLYHNSAARAYIWEEWKTAYDE